MRLDVFFHVESTHEAKLLDLILKGQGKIMASQKELNDKIVELTTITTELAAAVDLFIESDKVNFQKLLDAIAAADPIAIQTAIDTLEAARVTLATTKDKVTAADAADNLP